MRAHDLIRATNTIEKWRKRSHDLETTILRLWYFIENGHHDSGRLNELKLEVKTVLGVRPIWKKQLGRKLPEELKKKARSKVTNFKPWNVGRYYVIHHSPVMWDVCDREADKGNELISSHPSRAKARAAAHLLNGAEEADKRVQEDGSRLSEEELLEGLGEAGFNA
jgi:hypothetical protein